jgi:predicted esterase
MRLPYITLVALLVFASTRLAAQPGEPLPRGRVVERVRVDSIHSYALYLPSAWTAERRWPVLVALDPGGRALLPLERFREAAERRGWVVMSAYDVRNGDAAQMAANERAVDAMLADAQRRFAMDPRRLYFAGLSGMARFAWGVVAQLDGHAAGLIGAAAGFPRAAGLWVATLRQVRPFPYFGTTGTTDFNREEMDEVDSALDATSLPHRLARFEGEHEWPPAEVAAQAVDWLELQAMHAGTVPVRTAFVDSLYAAGIARARALEAARAPLDAEREYRALVGDFTGLHATAEPAARAAALARDPAVGRARARRAASARRVYQHREAIDRFADELRRSTDGTVSRGTLASLRTAPLLAEERDSVADRERSQAAARMLATLLVVASDAGGDLMRERRYAHAATAFRVAHEVRPTHAGICRALARALAQTARADEALDALACAIAGGTLTRAELESDALLAPLRTDPRFAAIVARAR